MITKKMFDEAIQVIQEFGLQQGLSTDPDEEFWNILQNLGWGKRITDYKIFREKLEADYPNKILPLHQFVKEKSALMEDRLTGFAARYGTQRTFWGIDQLDFSEMVAHMVAFGKDRFYSVMQDPLLAKQAAASRAFIPHFMRAFGESQAKKTIVISPVLNPHL